MLSVKVAANVWQICDGRAFLAQILMRRTELSATTKLSAEHETPPIANVLLVAVFIALLILPHISFRVLLLYIFQLYYL